MVFYKGTPALGSLKLLSVAFRGGMGGGTGGGDKGLITDCVGVNPGPAGANRGPSLPAGLFTFTEPGVSGSSAG